MRPSKPLAERAVRGLTRRRSRSPPPSANARPRRAAGRRDRVGGPRPRCQRARHRHDAAVGADPGHRASAVDLDDHRAVEPVGGSRVRHRVLRRSPIGTTNTGTPTALGERAVVAGHVLDEHLGEPQPRPEPHVLRLGPGGERRRPLPARSSRATPVHPAWTPLGQAGNVMQLRLATTGLDASGNPTTGWTPEQVATDDLVLQPDVPDPRARSTGRRRDSYTVTAVRDLRYTSSNIFIPSLDEIHMDDGFYPQLFTHELVHAFRNDRLLSSDQNWNFDSTLSPFEESFAQAVSYEAMNDYVAAYPNDTIVPGNIAVGIEQRLGLRLPERARAAGHRLLERRRRHRPLLAQVRDGRGRDPQDRARVARLLPALQRRSTTARINANPTVVRPTRALIVDIITDARAADRGRARRDVGRRAEHLLRAERLRRRRSSTGSRTTRRPTSSRSRTCTSWRRCRAAASGRAGTARSGSTTTSTARRAAAGSWTRPAAPSGRAACRSSRRRTRPTATSAFGYATQEPHHRDVAAAVAGRERRRLRDEPADLRALPVREHVHRSRRRRRATTNSIYRVMGARDRQQLHRRVGRRPRPHERHDLPEPRGLRRPSPASR